jgi:hypothetical protein
MNSMASLLDARDLKTNSLILAERFWRLTFPFYLFYIV